MLVGFDPSCTKFGFAFGLPTDRAPKSGVWRLPGADDVSLARTIGIAAESVSNLLKMVAATHVVIEAPILAYGSDKGRSAHTSLSLMQLVGAVRAATYRAGCVEHLPARASVLKIFTGNGRPDDPKWAVMETCEALGWQFDDNNAADACACWAYGLHHFFHRAVHPLLQRAVG